MTWVTSTRKVKTILYLTEARDDRIWGWHGISRLNANNLHLARDRKHANAVQHHITQFFTDQIFNQQCQNSEGSSG